MSERQVSGHRYVAPMPEISRFFGIVVRMHFTDHMPPHFHAAYGEFEAEVAIDGLRVLKGHLPPRVLGLTVEWASGHLDELRFDWTRAETRQELKPIAPLR